MNRRSESEDCPNWPQTAPLDTEAVIRSQKVVLEVVDYLSLSILIKYVLNYILDFLEYVYSSFYQLLVIIT